MEQLEELFDACDTAHSGKVPVSKLILAVTNDAFNNNDHQQHEKEEILQTVRYLLDPSEQDVGVDKATWMAAWHKQAESPSPKKSKVYTISDLAGGDDLGIGDEYQGPLDVSKQSYCFSPSSRSSSVEDTEEVVLLKEEIQLLQCALKTQKHQLQKLEDALNQEQIEKQELEKLKDAEVNKLSRQNKSLLESNELLKCSLEGSESEKLELCESLSATERQLNLQLTEQKRVVAELSSELEDSNQEIENLKSNIKELQTKLEHQANVQQEQMLDYQKTIQNYIEEKNELRSQITNSVLHKRHVSSYSDDLDSSGISNLESELAPFNFQANSMLLSDSPPSLQKSLLVEMQALSCHAETQTEQDFNVTPPIPLELIDKCIQVEVDSEEVVLLKEEIQQLKCALKTQKQQLQKLEDALNQAQIEKQELEKLKDAEVNKLSQQILSPVERNEIPKTSVSMSDREEHDLCKSFDSLSVTERQSNLEQKRLVAASSTEIEDLNQEIENFTSYIPELQTKLELRTNVYQEQMIDYQGRIRNHQEEENELSSQITSFYADIQTQGVLTVSSLIPLERVDQGIQAEVQMCSVDSQTSPQAPENDYKLCSSRFFSKYFLQKLPLTNATDVARKSPDLSLKISDKQGSVHNKFSSALPHKSSCLWVIFIFVAFFVLLIISTIFCTGAVLNIASDAGVMSYPYAGPTSDFVERIFKPFVKIKLRPVGNNVPV